MSYESKVLALECALDRDNKYGRHLDKVVIDGLLELATAVYADIATELEDLDAGARMEMMARLSYAIGRCQLVLYGPIASQASFKTSRDEYNRYLSGLDSFKPTSGSAMAEHRIAIIGAYLKHDQADALITELGRINNKIDHHVLHEEYYDAVKVCHNAAWRCFRFLEFSEALLPLTRGILANAQNNFNSRGSRYLESISSKEYPFPPVGLARSTL